MGEFKFYVIKHLWYFRNLVIKASMSLSFHSESYHLEIMACKNLYSVVKRNELKYTLLFLKNFID